MSPAPAISPATSAPPIAVSVVEDDAGYRNLLSSLLGHSPGFLLAGAHPDVPSLMAELKSGSPRVVLMDIELPGLSGLEGVRQALAAAPDLLVIMLTAFGDHEKVFPSLRAGSVGYLLKTSSLAEIQAAILDAVNGGSPMSGPIARMLVRSLQPQRNGQATDPLSERERQLLDFLSEGLRYKEAADRMGISINTVRTHIRRAYQKLHVQSRAEAVRNRR